MASDGDGAGWFLVKMGLSAVALIAFIIPEAASSVTGMAVLGGIWGMDLLDGGSD